MTKFLSMVPCMLLIRNHSITYSNSIVAGILIGAMSAASAVELDVPYVESPPEIVDLMMEMSAAGRGDYVIDLGTGDGRIVIAAVKRGAVGHGIDLDPQRVKQAEENASKAGLSDRISFLEQDLFESDLSRATVVSMFLNSEVNLRVRPILLEQLKPGTRVVSHNFDMGEWQPDKHQQFLRNTNGNFFIHDVYLWVVPADLAGTWGGQSGDTRISLTASQTFQAIEARLTINETPVNIESVSLYGDRLNIIGQGSRNVVRYTLSGRVEEDRITGYIFRHGGADQGIGTWTLERN